MVMVGYAHQGEEAVIYVAYFKVICAVGVQRRDKGSALSHINVLELDVQYIEDIQVLGVNMSFISLSEVKLFYIS